MANWGSAEELTDAPSFHKGDIGYFDPNPMAADYKLIETYFKLKKPLDTTKTYNNDFRDLSVRLGT